VEDKGVPGDTLITKCQRLLPRLSSLPNLRGKSALGRTSQLFGLVLYEDARTLLKKLPKGVGESQALTEKDIDQRKKFFSMILEDLKAGNTMLSPAPSPVLLDIFGKAAENDYMDWMRLSRTDIALDIVTKVIKQTPDYFLHSVKRLRNQALRLKFKPLKSRR